MLKETKLRDVTKEEFKRWSNKNCAGGEGCIFRNTQCCGSASWVNHKDLYSDKFLDQTIDIEVPDPVVLTKEEHCKAGAFCLFAVPDPVVLTKEEHDYLEAVIKPFRWLVKFIEKRSGASVIVFKNEHKENIAILPLRDICLSEMKSDYPYKIEEIGL
jgi:hypothetical protein